jgi:hypothetical protein
MTLHFADDNQIEHLAAAVQDRSLPKAQWTHAAHFAAVLWLLRHHPERSLEIEMPGIIRRYNEATGVANTDDGGYHETITQASIMAARAFLNRHPGTTPLHEILDRLMASPLGRSDWVLSHWTKARLFSVEARHAWLAPDIQGL